MIINKTISYLIKSENQDNNINTQKSSTSFELDIHEDYKKSIYLIHKCTKWQLGQNRQSIAHTKTRDEVRGGGKKPWKQKGTGRARAGSTRSPLWKGGGVIFGPRSSKIYKSKINKKEKNLAVRTLLYNKSACTFIIPDTLKNLEKPNTKNIIKKLIKLNINITNAQQILLVVNKKTEYLYQSIKNITNVDIIQANHLNTLALVKADYILLTQEGFNQIKQLYASSK